MTSMNVPEPVMSLAVQPVSKDSGGQVSGFHLIWFCICEIVFNGTESFCFLLLVFEGFESFSERRSYLPCWLGPWERTGLIDNMISLSHMYIFSTLRNDYLVWPLLFTWLDNHIGNGRAAFGSLCWTHSERI